MSDVLYSLKKLIEQLRDKKNGCPWIIEQDFKSLIAKTLEESYELADSIDQGNFQEIRDELADLLLHIVLYAEMGEEQGLFNLNQIAQAALDKQTRRKLEFPDPSKITAKEALQHWEIKKQEERQAKEANRSVLDGVSTALPALHRALKLQLQAASVGFDWPEINPVFDKLDEEILELKNAVDNQNKTDITDELGDLFFTCVALAKHMHIDPEIALRHANLKFEKRFKLLEEQVKNQGKKVSDLDLSNMEEIWQQVKKQKV